MKMVEDDPGEDGDTEEEEDEDEDGDELNVCRRTKLVTYPSTNPMAVACPGP